MIDLEVGKQQNQIREIDCPRCGKQMEQLSDPVQTHIQYEACPEHGMYFDADGRLVGATGLAG